MSQEEQIESKLTKVWFHLRILDELVSEIPKEVFRHISKTQKKGDRDKLSIQYKLDSLLRATKGIHEIDLFKEDENQTQVAASIIEVMRDMFLNADLETQYSFAKLWESFNGELGKKLSPEVADELGEAFEKVIKKHKE